MENNFIYGVISSLISQCKLNPFLIGCRVDTKTYMQLNNDFSFESMAQDKVKENEVYFICPFIIKNDINHINMSSTLIKNPSIQKCFVITSKRNKQRVDHLWELQINIILLISLIAFLVVGPVFLTYDPIVLVISLCLKTVSYFLFESHTIQRDLCVGGFLSSIKAFIFITRNFISTVVIWTILMWRHVSEIIKCSNLITYS